MVVNVCVCYLHAKWCVLRTEGGIVLLWGKLPVSHEAARCGWGRRRLRRGQVGARRRKVSLEHSTNRGEPRPQLGEGQRENVVVHKGGGAWEIKQGLGWKAWLCGIERVHVTVYP